MSMFNGKITEINKFSKNWVSYVERMTLFFEANGIDEETKKGYFTMSVRAQTYKLLKSLSVPNRQIIRFKNYFE